MGKNKEWQKRNTLAITGFFGLALMYSLRFNISIGIVAMVDETVPSNSNNTDHDNFTEDNICPALVPLNSTNSRIPLSQGHNDLFPKFKWSEKDQGLILGSFFWGYILSQVPGGLLGQRFGGKWVVSLGVLCSGILSLILPWAALNGGMTYVIIIRVLQGLSGGFIIPAFTVLLAKWTAPHERGGIATLCFSGMPFGTAATMIISGHLISSFGWPSVFYVPGILSIVWFIVWSMLVYSTPSEHPSISPNELIFIENAINEGEKEKPVGLCDIPWKDILCSIPVWAIFISHFCNTWGHNTLKSEGPKYLHSVLHFDIHQNAYIAATPYLCALVFCNVVTRLSDYLISRNWISVTTSRKLCNSIGQAGTGLAYLGLLLSDCNRSQAIVFYMLTGALNGAIYGGFLINPIDIAPNYSGVLEGLVNGISNIAGFGAPYLAGLILHNESSIFGWKMVFLIPVIADLLGNLCFVLFSSTKVQSWNSKGRKEADTENH